MAHARVFCRLGEVKGKLSIGLRRAGRRMLVPGGGMRCVRWRLTLCAAGKGGA